MESFLHSDKYFSYADDNRAHNHQIEVQIKVFFAIYIVISDSICAVQQF